MQSETGARHLMPTYDHASSFGFGLTDSARELITRTPAALDRWCRQGFAGRFEGFQKRTLVDAALAAAEMLDPAHRAWWRYQLEDVGTDMYKEIVLATPRTSEVAATFTVELLDRNLGRLLDVF
jgi:hypothetical protein